MVDSATDSLQPVTHCKIMLTRLKPYKNIQMFDVEKEIEIFFR